MADTYAGREDDVEENPHGGSRVLPFSTTPRLDGGGKADPVLSKAPVRQVLYERLGLEELAYSSVWRASVAEVLGTAVLVFLIDTIVISSIHTETNTPNLLISFLVFLSVTILLLATAPVSGGHINPIVTFTAALLGLISPARAAVYVLAQCCGAVVGAVALKAVVGGAVEHAFMLGGCALRAASTAGMDTSQGLWLETICTFVFLYASIWIAFDKRQARAHGPVVVCAVVGAVLGLLVFVSLSVTGRRGYSGAGINPARCVGPALVRGGHLWDDHWVYWVGPAIGCVIFYLYIKIAPPEHFRADHDFKYDCLTTLKALLY
ncbi:hypothetical protein H6P81_020109 [Aristolochia fimbriata]|uniref:Uncharacterized protein n=1 Tax=Aristolochia fimbriata TaxID=158543 RepID=A0AAV7DVF2_ARIFI|nr:hypothetical protein H6P81_020109 [Aristolochia fimbriata]